jgi:hypothetical protein
VRFGETLLLEGLIPSIGTVGDALDNALAETTIGLYKTECVREGSPFRHGPITKAAWGSRSTQPISMRGWLLSRLWRRSSGSVARLAWEESCVG